MPFIKGHKFSEEHKKKLSLSHKGLHSGYKFPKGNSIRKGSKNSLETRLKISLSLKGKKKSQEWCKKLSDSRKKYYLNNPEEIEKRKSLIGDTNPNWKGNNVSYKGLHQWIRKHKSKPKLCEHCSENKKLEVANISREYKRDFSDWLWLCNSCHKKFDGATVGWKGHTRVVPYS